MYPDDDPEARIRQLEQPLADTARASELGGNEPPGYAVPPPPPVYGYGEYGGMYPPPASASSGSRVFWIVGAMFVVGILILVGGIVAFAAHRFSDDGVVVGSPAPSTSPVSTSSRPMPSIKVPPALPSLTLTAPTQTSSAPPAGATLTVSGVGENRTIACTDNVVSVSGVSNTVVITGHCTRLSVSGVKNSITVDAADTIDASGMQNQVTYHSGSPKIKKSGQSNVVQQG
ncbi:hypothetical protein A5791_11570 [Mycobacterium sp. 852002-51163_SCH5372311]|uniref:DUF3060 domain-containing protein n=1 Tax=Mycobacterium sp. 852002-51163_SCH5372311 TaxID=1834097 RepID=UPI0007FBCD4F|nr:DUF3060 domain-containing protein [Mycobacterium sp. 852002-51163_SCH5372311]OBF79378.1 hypothetical protein A5791_11570 [Mycobacterium sp. 852002-51163_SCH5372311]